MCKKNTIIFSMTLLVIILDQLTKFLITTNFKLNESVPLINNILHFTYVTNTGSAFGLFKNLNLFLTIISFIVIFVVIYNIKNVKKNNRPMQILAGMLLGGIIGNLIDRLMQGYVIDFIDLRIWPVFNVADSFITISIIGMIIFLWKESN